MDAPDLVWRPALLPLIFENLKECKPPQSQAAADAVACAKLLSDFIHRHADLASHPNLLGSVTAPSELTFYPEYGCAMFLLVSLGCAAEQTVYIHLIGLDDWSFYLLPQRTDTAGNTTLPVQTVFTSAARAYAPLCGGKLPLALLDRFKGAFDACLARAQQRKGDQRSAGANEQGHQKTPAFLEAIVQDALATARMPPPPPGAPNIAPPAHPARGGFTDVGLHTGGLPRHTAWPLARAAMQFLLEQSALDADEPAAVMRRLVVAFKFALLASHLSAIETSLATPTATKLPYSSTDTLMHMLDGIACDAIEYPAQEHVAARAQVIRTRIECLAKASATGLAAQFTLADTKYFPRDTVKDKTGLAAYAHLTLTLPPPLAPEANASAVDAARSRALANSGARRLVLTGADTALHRLTATELYSRLNFDADSASLLTQLEAMHSVEHWFYAVTSAQLCREGAEEELAVAIDSLLPLVERYRLLVAAFLASERRHALLREEVMSRETLVVWLAYCLADKLAAHRHPILRKYHASLQPGSLRHLVLSDKIALSALLAMADYLRVRSGSSPVFSGLANDVTLQFAEEYAASDAAMVARLEAETEVARRREAEHWAKAQQWKAELQEARAEYAEAEQGVEEQRALVNKAHQPTRAMNQTLQTLIATSDWKARVVSEKSVVRETLFQALAKSRQLATRMIFFAMIPPALATLHRLSFMAQQMLVPRIDRELPPSVKAVPVKTNLESDYSCHSAIDHDQKNARLWSPAVRPSPGKVQPQSVDALSETQLNVHYPDDIMQQAQLAWFGGGFALDLSSERINPFMVTAAESAAKFAAELPEGKKYAPLAFAFKQCISAEVPATRSNEPIADQKPARLAQLSTPQYLAFASLRAYPNLQIRKISVAIRQRSLPFASPLVQLLLRTALYHVGELAFVAGEASFPIWKSDLVIADGLPVLYEELTCLADELSEKPREHQMLLAVIDAAVYLRGWDIARPERDALRRKCADIACKWARRIDEQLARLTGSAAASARATQCLFYMYALLTLGGAHDLDDADTARLCDLRVRTHQGLVDEVHCPDETKPLFRRLALRVDGVVAARLRWLLSVLPSRGHCLTAAVRAIVHTAPDAMEWRPYRTEPPSALFDAVCDNHLYTINLHSGTVLVDGLPPCTLPDEIRKHPVYARSFGDRDFRVVPKGGRLQSNVVHDIYYEFYLSPATKRLFVWEINKPTNERLELLDGTDVAAWCAALPARLTELHSHWLSRTSHCILLRPRHFEQRAVDFVLLLAGEPGTAPAPCECVRVPTYRSGSPWRELVALARAHDEPFNDCLVVWPQRPPLLTTLAKFENVRYIHTYVAIATADREIKLKIEFPRFRMEFEVVCTHADSYEVLSADYRGYRLCRDQQLADTLCGFTTYLLLEQIRDRNDFKMLVPAGSVVPTALGADRSATLAIAAKCDAELSCRTYYVHQRYNELRTCGADLAARLQLAALYAATSTALPEPKRKMTGVEVAIELVRQCFVNRPLDAHEREQLSGVEQFSFKSPALYLACRHLAYTSEQMAFLYAAPPSASDAPVAKSVPLQPSTEHDCVTEYQLYCARAPPNPRLLLSAEEEARLTGLRVRHRTLRNASLPPWTLPSSLLRLGPLPVAADLVRKTEDRLAAFVVELPAAPQAAPVASPVAAAAGAGALEREMKRELDESWRVYRQQPTRRICVVPEALRPAVAKLLREVRANRAQVEAYVLDAVRSEPPAESVYAPYVYARRLLCAANRVPQPSMRDVVQSLWVPTQLADLNFFLSLCPADCDTVRSGALRWLELCVLEDKLARIVQKLDDHLTATTKPASMPDLASASAPSAPVVLPALGALPPPPPAADAWPPALLSDLLKELTCRREWSVADHPMWLAFEADSRLQIRPVQYHVASQLDCNPRAVVQLNMGEGKTRVILPMLVLRWIADRRHVVRLHLLSELISEGFDFLHEHLCAGTLNRKLFLMPFNRDVALTTDRLRAMQEHVAYCQREGGVVLLTPESRCSLQLKLQELYADESERGVCKAITAYEALPWRDVFDESDELLRHKLQVIYAVGAPMRLPALEERCVAVQVVLHALLESPALKTLLSDDRIAVCHAAASLEGFYTTLRLLPGELLDEKMPRLTAAVADAVLSAPPYEMNWLRKFGRPKEVLRYVTDSSAPADAIIPPADFTQPRHRDALLALRGLLVHGLLESCLTHRHRVTYGLRDPGGVAPAALQAPAAATKRLAVPYRACDVPSERCEFAHPDTAILLTHLAYLYDGLTKAQVLEAVATLLECGSIEQREVYNLWLVRSHRMEFTSLSSEEISSIDSPDKIDRSNIEQQKLLYRAFSRNVQTVFFWLSNVALPDDTKQYAHRIKSSAWHVAHHGDRCAPVGFSGTNDSHRLLPLHVAQHPVSEAELQATNGRMLDLIQHHSTYELLPHSAADPAWQRLLHFAVLERRASALIDSGALLAGISGAQCAEFVVGLLHKLAALPAPASGARVPQAVVYFDQNKWFVRNRAGRVWPKASAPVAERDAFVLFDQQHCRGADMRLRPDAEAVLTLGPSLCKDKQMQAAGRLRQLGCTQTLRIVAQADVDDSIRRLAKAARHAAVTPEHVLQWVMANTVRATEDGLLEWAGNGLHFLQTRDHPERSRIPEVLHLNELYQAAVRVDTIDNNVARLIKERVPTVAEGDLEYLNRIKSRTAEFGTREIVASVAEEECERELEQETEREEEQERQLSEQRARSETDWEYETALKGWAALPKAAYGTLASAIAANVLKASLTLIGWNGAAADAPVCVYTTHNFFNTVCKISGGAVCLGDYLRPLDVFLYFRIEGVALLVSDREANALLPRFWQHHKANKAAAASLPVSFVHLSYARDAQTPATQLSLPSGVLLTAASLVPPLVRMQLFNGDTTFPRPGSEGLIASQLLTTPAAKSAALLLPRLRGYAHMVARSHLEMLCDAEGAHTVP